jgi:excisionase family DNA binding protein
MTTQVLQFVELSDKDRKAAQPLGEVLGSLGKGDRVEVRVRRKSGKDEVVSLPPKAAALLEAALGLLIQGERVAVLAEDIEISPNDAAEILGMSRPLVVHRMNMGDLPFHYVGTHRRAKLKDVLAFKKTVDAQQAAVQALVDDAEDLRQRYGV